MSIQSYIYQDPQEASAACAVKRMRKAIMNWRKNISSIPRAFRRRTKDTERLAAAAYVENFHKWRITLLPWVLAAAYNYVGGWRRQSRTAAHRFA